MAWLIAFLIRTLILAGAVWLAAYIVPGIQTGGWQSILAVAVILGVLNALLRPLLVIISIPLLILTLGLFVFVINTVLLLVTEWVARQLDIEFAIDSFWDALIGAVIISIVSFIVSRVISPERLARQAA